LADCEFREEMENSDLGLLSGNGKNISILTIKKRILKIISMQFLTLHTKELSHLELTSGNEVFERQVFRVNNSQCR
jgi:hypothetical protein